MPKYPCKNCGAMVSISCLKEKQLKNKNVKYADFVTRCGSCPDVKTVKKSSKKNDGKSGKVRGGIDKFFGDSEENFEGTK